MILASLAELHSAPQFPNVPSFTLVRIVGLPLDTTVDAGELATAYGYPCLVYEWSRDERGIKSVAEVRAWMPDELLASELASGRFQLVEPAQYWPPREEE